MNNNKKINEKEVLCLFSNIALLNAKEIIEKNINVDDKKKGDNKTSNESKKTDEIKESDLHNNIYKKEYNKKSNKSERKCIFENNKFWQLIFKSIKNENKKNNVENNNEKEWEKKTNEIFELIIEHLSLTRNLYSHNDPHYTEKNKTSTNKKYTNKEKHKLSIKKLIENKLSVYLEYNCETPLFKDFKDKDWDVFIIQMFLHKSEFNELKKHFLNFKILENFHDKFLRKYKLKLVQYKIIKPFYLEFVNYINNFQESKNKRKFFLQTSIKLLNYFYKGKLKASLAKNNRRGLVVEIVFLDKNGYTTNEKIHLNLQGVRQLLIWLSSKNTNYLISKNIFVKKSKKNIEEKKYDIENEFSKIFKKRVESWKTINNMHLLKLLNKSLLEIENGKKKSDHCLNQTLFNQFLQFFETEKIAFVNTNHENFKKVMKTINLNENNTNILDWKKAISNFILEKINTFEKYKKIFKEKDRNNINNEKNTKIWNNYELWVCKEANEKEIILKNKDKNIYAPIFDFKNLKNENDKSRINQTKELIAPILLFFHQKTKELADGEYESNNFIENLFKKETIDEIGGITFTEIIKTFEKRIWKSKSSLFSWNNDMNTKMKIEPNVFISNYEIINSKIFRNFKELCGENASAIDIIKEIEKYKKNEHEYIRWALKNENNKKRDFILHRSIRKFNSLKEINNFFNQEIKKYPYKKNDRFKNNNYYSKNKEIDSSDDDKEMKNFKEEMEN